MGKCAYCGNEGKMTREHVIPSFLYEFQRTFEKAMIGWNESAEKMLSDEAKIKDVCLKCNNENLSSLDNGGKKILSDAGLLVHNFDKNFIDLKYDFDMLMRWLLKISFNSARTDRVHSFIFEPFVDYILYGKNRIPRSRIALLVYFAAPEKLGPNQRNDPQYRMITGGKDIFNPLIVRISYGRSSSSDDLLIRSVTFGALVFYLLISPDGSLPGHAAAAIRKFMKTHLGSVELTPKSKFLRLTPGKETSLDLQQHQFNRIEQKSHVNALYIKNTMRR
jgi:hypothetical protein